jgi:ADP-ribosylglycohydrolase
MALMLARCLVRDGAWRAHEVLAAYRAWRASGPFDIGGTTQAGLAGEPILGSEANGSLMRISPLAVFAHALSPDRAAALARFDSALTHPNTVCLDACAAFTVAVSLAVRTGAGPEEVHAAALEHARGSEAHPSVVAALARAREQPPAEYLHQQGWVLIALQNAFYQLLHAPDLEEGLVRTVAAGGDTDTNAAIAGALLGAVFGRDAVPARWQRALLSCRPLAGVENVRRPRSAAFWPVDALLLAEQLLYAGVSHGDTAD